MTDLESARELERLMRAYGDGVLRLCYVCLRDEGHKKGGCERQANIKKYWKNTDLCQVNGK